MEFGQEAGMPLSILAGGFLPVARIYWKDIEVSKKSGSTVG
jgi:hypothetical protein